MTELRNLITKMHALRGGVELGDVSQHHLHQRQMSKDRMQFAQAMAEIAQTASSDPRLAGDRTLSAEFQKRFTELRHTMSRHQASWTADRMVAEPAAYKQSTTQVSKTLDDFLNWGRRSL